MDKLPEEQPPTDDAQLAEWLTRLVVLINGTLDNVYILPRTTNIPNNLFIGLVIYYEAPLPLGITHEGPWVYTSTGWKAMVSA